MPRDHWFRAKIRKIEATYAALTGSDIESDSSQEAGGESSSDDGIRASTPVSTSNGPPHLPILDDENYLVDEDAQHVYEEAALAYDDPVLFDNDIFEERNILFDGVVDQETDSASDTSGKDDENEDLDFSGISDVTGQCGQERLWQCVKLNESCQLGIDNLCALLAASQIVHGSSDTAMNFFCKVLSMTLPRGNVSPSSYLEVIKYLLPLDVCQTTTYVCSSKKCSRTFNRLFDVCGNPACDYFQRKQHCCGYSRMGIQQQIEAIVKSHYLDIIKFLSSCIRIPGDDSVGDIPSTPAYSSLGDNPDGNKLFISLILSSDGAQAFKSGRTSFWPCVAIIAELPPKIRASIENAICLGFWVGRGEKGSPDWRLFLPPIISEINSLKDGFDLQVAGKSILVCVRIFATVFDLLAQASIWGMKRFNGYYGCIQCRHPGERNGSLCLWPKLDPSPAIKDADFFKEAWRRLARAAPGIDYFGVKEISPLSRICNPAHVNLFDSMHMVYRGNAQLIIDRLFISKPERWTALFGKSLVSDVDKIIRTIRFPHYFNRKIPSLHTIRAFKASEIKNLVLYAILPITSYYMQEIPNYWHWMAIFVHAIRLLSLPRVSTRQTNTAQKLIDIWQKLIPEMCHKNAQSFNAHALEHLPNQVNQFGPLWSISAFPFESFNGNFARFIKSAKGALDQLGRRFALQQASFHRLSKCVRQEDPFSPTIKTLFPDLYERWQPRTDANRYRLINENCTCYGPEILEALQRRFPGSSTDEFRFSTRGANGSEILHSIAYSKKTASIVRYLDPADNSGKAYGEVMIFFSLHGDVSLIVRKFKCIMPTNILEVEEPDNELLFSVFDDRIYGSFFHVVEATNQLDCVQMADILCSAVLIESHGTTTVTDVLPFEHD